MPEGSRMHKRVAVGVGVTLHLCRTSLRRVQNAALLTAEQHLELEECRWFQHEASDSERVQCSLPR